ncbi:MAG TPA: hypothetical protein VH986_07525 [Acidimicrobiia bacterium]|jgi:hypothetical protein
MPPSRSDTRLLLGAAGAVLAAGVLIAVVLLFATSGSGGPKQYEPFQAGLASAIRSDLKDGGPFYFPDPFGGNRSILFAIEDGKVVALSTVLPGTKDCLLKWKAQVDAFVDCHGGHHQSEELDRYDSYVDASGQDKGLLFVDLRKLIPAPSPAVAS